MRVNYTGVNPMGRVIPALAMVLQDADPEYTEQAFIELTSAFEEAGVVLESVEELNYVLHLTQETVKDYYGKS